MKLIRMIAVLVLIMAAEAQPVGRYDFSLRDLSGHAWTLRKLRGKAVLVHFWATSCAPCRAEMQDLNAAYHVFGAQGLVILGITYEDAALVRRFLSQHPAAYPILLDPAESTRKPFMVWGYPENVLFDRNGIQVASCNGRPSHERLIEMLSAAGMK
jgi:peroxiredoxin